MKIVVLWTVLLAVAVGFPLLALWGDRSASGRGPGPEDAWGFQRWHGLSAAQMAEVERALASGQRVEDGGLRPLAAERAQAVLATSVPQRTQVRLVLGVCALTGVMALVNGILEDDYTLGVVGLPSLLQLAVQLRQRRALQSALARNGADIAV